MLFLFLVICNLQWNCHSELFDFDAMLRFNHGVHDMDTLILVPLGDREQCKIKCPKSNG